MFRALGALTPHQREIVEMYYLDRLTQAEIAERLGVSRQAVGARLAAALASLRKIMKKIDAEGVAKTAFFHLYYRRVKRRRYRGGLPYELAKANRRLRQHVDETCGPHVALPWRC